MATTATATAPASVTSAANSSAKLNLNNTVSSSTDKSDPPTTVNLPDAEGSVKEIDDSKTTETTVSSVAGDNSGSVNAIEKKIRRAERFGVPVKLSEQEKRNTRAERFGTAPSSKGSEESKQSEEVKRKARAERFGLAIPSTVGDEEVKKKARLARFAPYAKPDTVEGEKRKARAIRFSDPPSKVNEKGNIEPVRAPIAGEAGGGL